MDKPLFLVDNKGELGITFATHDGHSKNKEPLNSPALFFTFTFLTIHNFPQSPVSNF